MTVDLEILCTWKVHTRCVCVQLVDKLCETKKKSHCLYTFLFLDYMLVHTQREVSLALKPDGL